MEISRPAGSQCSAQQVEDEVQLSERHQIRMSGVVPRAPGRPQPVRAGGRRRPAVATRDRMTAPPPAIREFFVRDVDSVGLRRPTHFGTLVYNLVYIFQSAVFRRRRIVPGRRLASLKIRA